MAEIHSENREEENMEQIYNPYLPLYEYVPDGEPHVFDGRVYIYGSHDVSGGKAYCEDHYVTWSAPVDNLRDWRYEGVIYRRTQDPSNAEDTMQLWAPDVTKGPDGRYYLYYCFSFYPEIGVAVSDSPAGPFEFYGHVKYPAHIRDGAVLREYMPFDPAVLTDDDGRVYLYYGFAPAAEKEMNIPALSEEELAAMPAEKRARIGKLSEIRFGENGMVAELEQDMITLKEEPRVSVPGGHHTAGTGFEGHGFFEASSIRKIGKTYYFVYSSHKSHELCYATSDKPDRDFVYGGTIVSNGDIGLNGREDPVSVLGNNHGGIVEVNGEHYIFYHRQTQGTEFSRQGCAEKITIAADGSIAQVEITSCGLNGGPLAASGSYPAAIACHLTCPTTRKTIEYSDPVMRTQTRITQTQNVSYITAVGDGTKLGYKYFNFDAKKDLALEVRGTFCGTVTVSTDEAGRENAAGCAVDVKSGHWSEILLPAAIPDGVHALYLAFRGEGTMDIKSFAFFEKQR